jgi:threonine dehydrogenase-like Zn-dependent dehydrogenase
MAYYPGGYAEYCLAWADLLHPMADHVSFEEEAMRDILGVAVHAVGRGKVQHGDVVLCVGGGPAGLSIAQVARARGVRMTVVSERSPIARRVVSQIEHLICVDPTEQTLESVLRQHAGSARVAAVFDTVGSADTISQALPLLGQSGTYVNLAVHDVPLSVNALALGSERTMTTSSNAFYRDEREAHQLIETGAVDVRSMITHRFPLESCQHAFDLLLRNPKEAYKVVLC